MDEDDGSFASVDDLEGAHNAIQHHVQFDLSLLKSRASHINSSWLSLRRKTQSSINTCKKTTKSFWTSTSAARMSPWMTAKTEKTRKMTRMLKLHR